MKIRWASGRWDTRLYMLGALVALELLMSFSFLGYLHVEPISITFAYIPVLLAAAILGPVESAAVGAVFGLASMWKAGARYVMDADRLFSPFASGYPFGSVMLSVGARILFALVVGLLCAAARRTKRPALWVSAVAFFGGAIHSLAVYSAMAVFFPEAGYGPMNALTGFATASNLVTYTVAALIVLLAWKLVHSRRWQEIDRRFEKARSLDRGEHYHPLSLAVVIVLTLCFAMAVAYYFVNRMDYVLEVYGIALEEDTHADLAHLQIQFLIGIISLMALVIVFMAFNRRYATYMDYEARVDSLTGALTRRGFSRAADRLLGGDGGSWFIMLDIDHFKDVNDRQGHPEGDRVLRAVAGVLRDVVGERGLVGRVGGDEFAVLLRAGVPRPELDAMLETIAGRIRGMEAGESRVSCSIGAALVSPGKNADALYRSADRLLYSAKEQGRDRRVVEEENDKRGAEE